MVVAFWYRIARWNSTCANWYPERSVVGKVKWRPALGSTAQNTLAVPQRSYSLSRLASLPGLAGDAGRTSACSVTGFSSKQTTGCAASYGRSYVSSTSSILSMYSSLRSATHHIFFPPRLEVVVEQQNSDGLSSHLRNQFAFYGFLGNEADRPTGATFGRVGAHHGDNPLLLGAVEHLGGAGALLLIERALQSCFLVAVTEPPNRLRREWNAHCDLRGTDFLRQLQQSQGPQHDPDLLHTSF